MTVTRTPTPTRRQAPPPPRFDWVPVVVIVALVAGLGALLVWYYGFRGESNIDKIEASIAAMNDGDVAGTLELYAEDASIGSPSPVTNEEFFGYLRMTEARSTIVEPCEEAVANEVTCTVRHEDILFEEAGLAPEMVHTYLFNDDGLVFSESVSMGEGVSEWLTFYTTFTRWLETASERGYAYVTSPGGVLMRPDTAPVFIANVEEFVAQSDIYPKL